MVERLVETEVTMLVHPTYLDPPGRLRFPRYYFVNSIGASLECTVAFMSLIHGGLFDRHDLNDLAIEQHAWVLFGRQNADPYG